ncbi:16S rRNA (adenine(1518)-N(6)/adenine(1519)-N(6))-dimethyltransferase RsmA [Ectothiorhodospiraceae bacterium WFHF3C12]|nr:16S rRNA (adenine(1518)-N(6)/adenine(1519)-N(6))-dimethyltransferase RsmA [Ectothiorhodospiraceae bacterium WFHF3C12]
MGHRPRRRFGQNFLVDHNVVERIVNAVAPGPQDHLLEIGPGLGALTGPLLTRVERLDVIEVDWDLAAKLGERFRNERGLVIHRQDALDTDLSALAGDGPLRVVGNLPYNISTPLIFHLLAARRHVADMHFMLQREVVERMAAAPGSRRYGRLSVMVQFACRAERLFDVPPGAFRPPPQVTSSIVRLVPHAEPPADVPDERLFARVVSQAFAQRRKTLRNTLSGLLTAAAIEAAGVDPGARAETLSLAQFAALTRVAAGS